MGSEIAQRRLLDTRAVLLKNNLGEHGFKHCEVSGRSVPAVYTQLGEIFREPIREAIGHTLVKGAIDPEKVKTARRFYHNLREIEEFTIINGINPVSDYKDALWGMAGGAGLQDYTTFYGAETPAIVLLTLQDDNRGGCLTGTFRVNDELVVMSHTEEDASVLSRVTKTPLVTIHMRGEHLSTVTYNDLLPGSATFGASSGFAVSCDYLRLNDTDTDKGSFINAFSWMVWRLGKNASIADIKKLAEWMMPFIDGYAINIVKRSDSGKVDAWKITCAQRNMFIEELGGKPGSFLVQSNVIDPSYRKCAPGLYALRQREGDMPEGYPEAFEKRLKEATFLAKYFGRALDLKDISERYADEIHYFLQNIMSLGAATPKDWGIANSFVGVTASAVVGKTYEEGMTSSIVVNLGPAIKGDETLQKQVNFW